MIVRKKANTIYIYIQTRPPESTPTPLTNYELQKAILFFFPYKFVLCRLLVAILMLMHTILVYIFAFSIITLNCFVLETLCVHIINNIYY